MENKAILLSSRLKGTPTLENFGFTQTDVTALQEGEVLLKALYVSVDPYMQGRMSDAKSYVPPYEVGKPIMGGIVAEVVDS